MGSRQRRLNLTTPPILLGLGISFCVVISALVSYRLGDSALEGVTQPPTNPTQKLINQSGKDSGDQRSKMVQFKPINLAQVEKETRIYIQNQQKRQKVENPADKPGEAAEKSEEKSEKKSP